MMDPNTHYVTYNGNEENSTIITVQSKRNVTNNSFPVYCAKVIKVKICMVLQQ